MTVRMHRSTDLGATAITGQQGKMRAMLLEVLCKGVPAVAPTSITQTGGLATCTMTGHKFMTGQTVSIYGAAQTEYNGNKVITVVDANTFTFAVSSGAVSPATGTITIGGQKTIGTPTSITSSSTTVTVSLTAHGFSVGNRAYIMGADQAEYNGWQTVATVTDANTFTFELASTQTPVTPATGTIYVRYGEAALGWTMPFTGTNKSIFQQGVYGSRTQGVIIADETNATHHTYGAGLHFAEGATALGAYTNLFYQTYSESYTGMLKSGTADATVRKWVVVGDGRTVMILTQPGAGATYNVNGWLVSYFGDYVSYLPNDAYPQLSGPAIRNSSYAFSNPSSQATYYTNASYGFATHQAQAGTIPATQDTYYPARVYRNHSGATGYINVRLLSLGQWLGFTYSNPAGALGYKNPSYATDVYPDPVTGGISMDKLLVAHCITAPNTGSTVIRGELRGLWNPLQRRTLLSVWANNDTLIGTGELAGKTFELFDIYGDQTVPSGYFFLETSDTWSV